MRQIEQTNRMLLAFNTTNDQMNILKKFIFQLVKDKGQIIPADTVIDYIDCILEVNGNSIRKLNDGTYDFS